MELLFLILIAVAVLIISGFRIAQQYHYGDSDAIRVFQCSHKLFGDGQ